MAPRAVAAAPTVEACMASYEDSQKLLDTGKLVGAARALRACGSAACPSAIQRECVAALAPLEARIPTVILVARDANKQDLPNVSVSLDGRPYKNLDGREDEIDPGPHTFRFGSASSPSLEQRVVINEREKGRFIEAVFPVTALGAAPSLLTASVPADESRSTAGRAPPAAIVLAALGGASLATSGYFGVSGLAARSDVVDCKGSCTESQVNTVNHRFLAADIALGVSVVALAAAAWIYFARPGPNASSSGAR